MDLRRRFEERDEQNIARKKRIEELELENQSLKIEVTQLKEKIEKQKDDYLNQINRLFGDPSTFRTKPASTVSTYENPRACIKQHMESKRALCQTSLLSAESALAKEQVGQSSGSAGRNKL